MKLLKILMILSPLCLSQNLILPYPPQNYFYHTQSELAGGGPFVFDSPFDRREVSFKDNVLAGLIQTNGQLKISPYDCPDFSGAKVLLTNGVHLDVGSCGSYNQLFGGGEIDTVSAHPFHYPMDVLDTLKEHADYIFDAAAKIDAAALKDTLIMTDIEFLENGSFQVKQWWYLMPPHFIAETPVGSMAIGDPLFLEGADINGDGEISETECNDTDDLRTCIAYEDSLMSYHAKSVTDEGEDSYLNSTISGAHGFAHFDFEPLNFSGNVSNNSYLVDANYSADDASVIYVRNGPVRVSGVYNRKYIIITDEYVTYRRHATRWLFGSTDMVPIDTVWCNIWLTDDLINQDGDMGDLSGVQPSDDCDGGSLNNIYMISGANVVVANTRSNGARNGFWDDDININAAIVALNESFVMHYWQNTLSEFNSQYSKPPFGDGRGIERFGSSGYTDYRGTIHLWGSIVQKYRGYTQRLSPGPYNVMQPGVGMEKDYHYDNNLLCNTMPFFPEIVYGCTIPSACNYDESANADNGTCLFEEDCLGINLNDISFTYSLHSIYPNPFNPITSISFSIAEMSHTAIKIYDINGNLISTLLDKSINAGHHQIEWNAEKFPSGVYFVKLIVDDPSNISRQRFTQTQKLMLLK